MSDIWQNSNHYWSNNKVKVYHGDVREVLKTFPDESIDMVITSPPRDSKGRFIKGYHYSPKTEFKKEKHWRHPQKWWNKKWLENEYFNKKKSANDIAKENNTTENNILYWLKKHNISRRNVSETRKVKHWGASGEKNPMFGRKGELSPAWKGGLTPLRQKLYASNRWKKIIKEIIKENGKNCQFCFKPVEKFDIHHKLSFSLFPEYAMEKQNLVILCKECHKKITKIDRKTIRINSVEDFKDYIDKICIPRLKKEEVLL